MNLKKDDAKSRYCVQYDDHSRILSSILCTLMEHQSLVDIAIRCGNNTIHAHKCILAANSSYFREQLEKSPGIEQIVINGLDFVVVKCLVEFMYCGETNIVEENFKYMIAASKLFQIRGIQALAADNHYQIDENIQIPPPLFLSKKPKYSSTYLPATSMIISPTVSEKMNIVNDPNFHRKLKRKYMKTEAEKACAKEAAASRLALEALQKELASTNQLSSFVIEDSCSETTVENFIPHTDDAFIDNLNQLEAVPLQVVNYADLNPAVLSSRPQILNVAKPVMGNPLLQYDNVNSPRLQEAITDKLRQIFGGDVPANVEIMFKTNDGNFMSVTDEVLQNITKDSLQYQVIDEHGRAGEVKQLMINSKDASFVESMDVDDPIAKYVNPIEHISGSESLKEIKIDDIASDQSILEAIIENEKRENEFKIVTEAELSTIQSIEEANARTCADDFEKKEAKLKPMNLSCAERSFCDEFLNDTKEIYGSEIACLESVDGLQSSETFLTIPISSDEGDPNEGVILKKIKITDENDENIDLTNYSPLETGKQNDVIILDDIDIKIHDIDAEKFEVRNRKLGRKKNK